MKIGILTFHWATNYGAVLQCYALQRTLMDMGHQVEVINYKPKQFDDSLYKFLRQRKFIHLRDYIYHRKMERGIGKFRTSKLNLGERIYTCDGLGKSADKYDVIVSGSDQVLNPYFLMNGDGNGNITPSYFLGFPYKGRRIGYAVSFGCVEYPKQECSIASRFIKSFCAIGVRENTGVDIVMTMGRNDAVVVPDPTILIPSSYYHCLADESTVNPQDKEPYVYSFFIRNRTERYNAINSLLNCHIEWNDEDSDYTIHGWLSKIKHSTFVITDSFHCMVMCLKLHKPFVVVTDVRGNVGMNDRFYTLLSEMNLTDHVIHKSRLCDILVKMQHNIHWLDVDKVLESHKSVGREFLLNSCRI